MKNAVIYARYSSERQNDQSIEGQLSICNDYAAKNGLCIVDTYIDRAMTGTNDNRPAFQQMLSDCAKPVVWDIVLVYAIDRFGRNSIEIAVNKQKLKKNGKTLISATQRTSENIDGTKNLDGILLENVYIGLAEYYSAELSQKVKRGVTESRRKNFFTGGMVIFGYKIKDKRVVVDEAEAEYVRKLYYDYSKGKSAQAIAAELTDQGITHNGKPFSKNQIYAMLRNKKYIGIAELSDGVYTEMYPPIVPRLLFDEVQAIVAKNKIGSKSVKTDYLLRGICFCGYCGRKIQSETGTSCTGEVKHYYKCFGRKNEHICNKSIVRKDDLEKLVVDTTVKLLSSTENVEAITERILQAYNKRITNMSLLNILQSEQADTQKLLDNVMKAIEQGIITPTTKRRMEELENKLAEINDKILIAQYKEQQQLTKEKILEFLLHALKYKPSLMIRKLIKKVVLYDDKIEIYYNYAPNELPDCPDNTDNRDFLYIDSSIFTSSCAPSLNSLNFFTVKRTFGLFCLMEEFKNFRA